MPQYSVPQQSFPDSPLTLDFVHAESKEEEEARLAKEAKAREEARAAAAATESARAAQQAARSEVNHVKTYMTGIAYDIPRLCICQSAYIRA